MRSRDLFLPIPVQFNRTHQDWGNYQCPQNMLQPPTYHRHSSCSEGMGKGNMDTGVAPGCNSASKHGEVVGMSMAKQCPAVPRTGMESFGVTLSWNVTLTLLLRLRIGTRTSRGQMDDGHSKKTPPQPLLKST